MSKKESFRSIVELAFKNVPAMSPSDQLKLFEAISELAPTVDLHRDAGRIAFHLPEFEKQKLDCLGNFLVYLGGCMTKTK